jgi:hypothetical protein
MVCVTNSRGVAHCGPPPAFIAWRRPHGGRWQAVASGSTEAEASKALHEITMKDRSGSFDSQVLPRGERP